MCLPTLAGKPQSAQVKLGNRISRGSQCHTSGRAGSSQLLSCVQHIQKMDPCFLQHHLPQRASHDLQYLSDFPPSFATTHPPYPPCRAVLPPTQHHLLSRPTIHSLVVSQMTWTQIPALHDKVVRGLGKLSNFAVPQLPNL